MQPTSPQERPLSTPPTREDVGLNEGFDAGASGFQSVSAMSGG